MATIELGDMQHVEAEEHILKTVCYLIELESVEEPVLAYTVKLVKHKSNEVEHN